MKISKSVVSNKIISYPNLKMDDEKRKILIAYRVADLSKKEIELRDST